MRYIEMHAHMGSRTTDDYEQMALTGCVAVTEPAFWAGYDRLSSAAFRAYFEQLTDFEPPAELPTHLSGSLKFLDDASLHAMFVLSPDLQAVPVEINRLDNQMLVRYYEVESHNWN